VSVDSVRPKPPVARRSFVQHVMGMPVSLLVRGPDARGPAVQAAVDLVYAELRRLDLMFSPYRPASDIRRLRAGDLTLDACDPLVRHVLSLCERARRDTDGWFEHELPGADGVRRLDPSGLVKGWATERASRALGELPGHDWLINVGGDVVVTGAAGPFAVGIQSPHHANLVLDVVEVRFGGVATSGSYARGGHVINPRTGRPAGALASVTVVGRSLLAADVLATAVYAEGMPGLARVERAGGAEAFVVRNDGSVVTTSGWPGRFCAVAQPTLSKLPGTGSTLDELEPGTARALAYRSPHAPHRA
jgi:thiamine biosynthesis lipoprotein